MNDYTHSHPHSPNHCDIRDTAQEADAVPAEPIACRWGNQRNSNATKNTFDFATAARMPPSSYRPPAIEPSAPRRGAPTSNVASSTKDLRRGSTGRPPKRVGFEPHPVRQVHYPSAADHDNGPIGDVGHHHHHHLQSGSYGSSADTTTNERWYSHRELVEMKRAAKRACTTRPDLEYALNDAYHRAAAAPALPRHPPSAGAREAFQSEGAKHDASSPSFTQSSPDVPQMLLEIPFFREQRGMERWCSKRHALSRGLTVLQVKTEVFVAQARKSMGNTGVTGEPPEGGLAGDGRSPFAVPEHAPAPSSDSDAAARDELCLADACAAASAPAVRFAQLLGRIDAIEAAEPDPTAAEAEEAPNHQDDEEWWKTAALEDDRPDQPHEYPTEENSHFFFFD